MPAGLVCCPRLLWPCCPRLTPASQLHSPALPRLLQPEDYYLQDDTVPLVNISFGAVLCSALLACWLVFVRRVYRSNLTGKRWSHRRRRAATMAGIELTLQLVNCIFFVVPNAWVLAHECSWMEPVVVWAGFVRWAGGRAGGQTGRWRGRPGGLVAGAHLPPVAPPALEIASPIPVFCRAGGQSGIRFFSCFGSRPTAPAPLAPPVGVRPTAAAAAATTPAAAAGRCHHPCHHPAVASLPLFNWPPPACTCCSHASCC